MSISQRRSRRKVTGGRYRKEVKKKKNLGRIPTHTLLGERKVKAVRIRASKTKHRLLKCDIVNAFDPKAKKFVKAKIETVVENPANRHFVRRNIITKGSILRTDKGNVRVTSRPGQEGAINGILV